MHTNFTANRITPAQMTKIITRLCSLEVNYEKFAWCSTFRSVPAPAPVQPQQPSEMAILFVTLLIIFLAGAVCTYFVEPRAERYRRRRLIAGEWE
jgi:hypothetical protein